MIVSVRLVATFIVTAATAWCICALMALLEVHSLVFAIALNCTLMAWITAVIWIRAPNVNNRCLDRYFELKELERNGKLYQSLGVQWFEALLWNLGYEKLRKPGFRLRRDYALLARMELEGKQGEIGHLICFIVVLLFAGYAGHMNSLRGVLWLLATGTFFHLYPIMLQRYLRPRLQHALTNIEASSVGARANHVFHNSTHQGLRKTAGPRIMPPLKNSE
jgi:hypothetical protein